MQQMHAQEVHGRREPAPARRRAGAPVWILLVGLALLVVAVGPLLVAPNPTTAVRPGPAVTAPAPAPAPASSTSDN